MGIKTKWKRNLILTITAFAILLSMLNPALIAFANFEDAQREFDSQASDFLKDAEDATDILKILEDDAKANPNPSRNTINYVMKRLFYPGVYVNDVRDGIVSSSLDVSKSDLLYDDKYVCHPNSPKNLIDHNCNIPNFTTGLIQSIADPFMTPLNNAGKTSSYSTFGLGVPSNIPGGTVPIDPESRTHTYTALELYGYSLKLTSYNGEWDNIVVSNSARMLSNFGVIDRITLVGTTLWNTTREGVSTFIENFSFNPVRWFGTLAKSFEAGASAGINTVVDTSELNIVATNAWKRPRLDSTLYNVYVMSDAEVLRETYRRYFNLFTEELRAGVNNDPVLNEVLSMDPASVFNDVPSFSYDPNWETDESKAAREKARKKREEEIAHNKAERLKERYADEDEPYKAQIISPLTEIPDPIYYTEQEQLGFWEEDPAVAGLLNTAKSNGLISGNASSYETYDEMMAEWEEAYPPYFERHFDALGDTVSKIVDNVDVSVFTKYPHLDPKQGISRYACMNPDGSIMRDSDGFVEYLYKKNNSGTTEYLNEKCAPARPPIGGGLFGHGWNHSKIDDTRHISNVTGSPLSPSHIGKNIFISTITSINSFIAKVTNVILELSFSPLLERLGVNEMIAKLIEGFRDTVFFPLATLLASVGALLLFLQLLRSGSALQLLGSIAITFVIFIAGATFLLHPNATLKLVDEVPSKLDKIIANVILVDDDGTSYCSTGSASDGIRSAQCNVWGAMVFEPWTHLQFGTGYDNLYAKGHAPPGSGEMKNKNEDLVGDARVNMGGGHVVHNWALYQLDKTKAGTINAKAPKEFLGVVDKDMYRLVDLQAGPDNAAKSDPRYFKTWTGENRSGFIAVLTLIQAILMAFAIGALGIAKIEASFMFSITLLFLPFMLLYALIPSGRQKLGGYVGNLISLLLRRLLITVMLAVMLKTINLGYSKADSLETGALMAIFISMAFIMYRKELLDLVTVNSSGKGIIGGDIQQLRDGVRDIIPDNIKQWTNIAKANVRGTVAGFAGSAAAATGHKARIRARRVGIWSELRKLDRLEEQGKIDYEEADKRRKKLAEERKAVKQAIINEKKMTDKEYQELMDESNQLYKDILEKELEINKLIAEDKDANEDRIRELYEEIKQKEELREQIAMRAAGGPRDSTTILSQALKGSAHSRGVIGRIAERRVRAEGYAPWTAYRDVKDAVFAEGADRITNIEDGTEYDVYRDAISHSKINPGKTSYEELFSREQGELKNDPRIQRRVRKAAKEREKYFRKGENLTAIKDPKQLEKIAKIVDQRRQLDKIKNAAIHPIATKEEQKQDKLRKQQSERTVAKADIIKKQIEEKAKKGQLDDVTIAGKPIFKDEHVKIEEDKLEKQRKNYEEIKKIQDEMEEVKDEYRRKVNEEEKEIIKKMYGEEEDE